MSLTNTTASIESHTYFPVSRELLTLVLNHGNSTTSLNAINLVLAQVSADQKNSVVTNKVPTAGYPVAHF